MLQYMYRVVAFPRRRRIPGLLQSIQPTGDRSGNERDFLAGDSGSSDGRPAEGRSWTSNMAESCEVEPRIFSTSWGYSGSLGTELPKDFTPQCRVCMDLDEKALPVEIKMTKVADLLLSSCPACLMLHTILQRSKKVEVDLRDFSIWLYSEAMGMTVYSLEEALPDELVLQSVQGYPSPWPCIPERLSTRSNSDPDIAAQTISQWLKVCDTSHFCGQTIKTSLLPTRVLEIQASKKVRVHQSAASQKGLYICLSHCWGGVVPLQLKIATFQQFQNDIPWDGLPRTFKHAIAIAEKLGIRYLWIDSLCILQDDLDDWRKEGSKMAEIYSGAVLTLAATASSDSTGGLYRCQDSSEILGSSSLPTVHCFTGQDGSIYKISVRTERDFAVMKTNSHLPLQQRAWFFQEWILSPRVVHFTNTMLYWECSEIRQLDDGTILARENVYGGGQKNTLASLTQRSPVGLSPLGRNALQTSAWHGLIHIYSELQLTYAMDIFPALQGITTRMAAERQCLFFAGLWEDSLIVDLLWRLYKPKHIAEYRAPSWSWASRSGEVIWQTARWILAEPTYLTPEVSIISITTDTTPDNPFGEVSGGELVLKGLCLPVEIEPQKHYTILRVKLDRADKEKDLVDLDDAWGWCPDEESEHAPGADILIMLIGLWPVPVGNKIEHESWFLVFERATNVGNVYRRIGLYWTTKLAYRARFLREAIEQELTII